MADNYFRFHLYGYSMIFSPKLYYTRYFFTNIGRFVITNYKYLEYGT